MPPRLKIRVPETWTVEHHTFFDENPRFEDGICTNLTEDLLQIRCGTSIIDVGFHSGRYLVMWVRGGDWEHPFRRHFCRHRLEVVGIIEEWMKEDGTGA